MNNPQIKKLKEKIVANKPLSLVIVIVIVALIPSLFFYGKYQRSQYLLQNPTKQAEAEAQVLIAKIGKLIELPTNEKPTVATVSDVTKLADQPFFANAKNGDRVLIYSLAKKAILFRESENKIIEVAPVNLGGNTPSTTSLNTNPTSASVSITPTPTLMNQAEKTYKVVIFNGTTISGFAAKNQKNLETTAPEFKVVSKGDASKSDYQQTLVVDLTTGNKSAAEKLAGVLNGKVGELPTGEKAPLGVDFLVILGSSN